MTTPSNIRTGASPSTERAAAGPQGSSHLVEQALAVLELLVAVEERVRQRRKSLADEIGRAAESIALNASEGRLRAGLDRRDLFRRAAGSAAELTTALRIARARGYVTREEHDAVEAHLDRVRAMLWRLTH